MSILEKALGEIQPGGEKDKVKIDINCGKDDKTVSSYSADYKVLYPQQAIEDNAILSVGGTVVNFPLEKKFFEIFSKKQKKAYDSKINRLIESLKVSPYLFVSSNQNTFESFDLFHRNIRISLNKYLVDFEKIELDQIPNLSINSLIVRDESIGNTISIKTQDQAFEYVSKNIDSLSPFVDFKFIPFEIISEISKYIASKLKNESFSYRYSRDTILADECAIILIIGEFQKGTVSEAELVEFVGELGYSDILGNTADSIINETLHRFISFLFPITKLSNDELFSEDKPSISKGYYTIIENKIIAKTPDISLENSFEGYYNAYNFNAKNKKPNDIYLFFSLVGSEDTAKSFLSKINIAPLPSFRLTGFLSIPQNKDGQMSFNLGFLQDGIVGGTNEKLGIPNSVFTDYKIILSPLSDIEAPVTETDDRSSKTNIPTQKNNFEYFSFPNLFLDYIDVDSFIDVSSDEANSEVGSKNPKNKLGITSLEGFFSKDFLSSSAKSITEDNGIISYNSLPEVFSSEFNLFGEISRPEIYFTSDNSNSIESYSDEWFKLRLSERSIASSVLTQFSRPNFFDTTPPAPLENSSLGSLEIINYTVSYPYSYRDIPFACTFLDLRDRAKTLKTDREIAGYPIIDVPIGLKEFREKYNFDKSAKFSAYIVDKYGQWAKARYSGNSELKFEVPNPIVKSITPDGLGENSELFIRETDPIEFDIKGLYLELVDTIRIVDSDGADIQVINSSNQSLDNLEISVSSNSIKVKSTSLFQDFLPTAQEMFVYVENSSISGQPLKSGKLKIFVNQTDDPSPPKEKVNNLYPGKITPLLSKQKFFFDIPLVSLKDVGANISLKSPEDDFGSDLYIYLAAPILNTVQNEEFVKDIFLDFNVSSDLVKIDNIASNYNFDSLIESGSNLRYDEISNSNRNSYIVSKRISFENITGSNGGFEGSFSFPGKYWTHNLSKMKNLKECSFLILNKKIEEVIGEVTFSDFSKLEDKNIYSIVRIGNRISSYRPFINTPFISNVVLQKNGSLISNSILRSDIERNLLKSAAKNVKGYSDKISSISEGKSLISGMKADFISVIFEAPSKLEDLSSYEVLVEGQPEKSGALGFILKTINKNKYRVVYRNIISDKAIIVIKDFRSSESGFLNIAISNTSKVFGNTIKSDYFKRITVSSLNVKRGGVKSSFSKDNLDLVYNGETSIFVNSLDFDKNGDVPQDLLLLDQRFLPLAKDRKNTNDFLTLTNPVTVVTFPTISIGGVLAESSENANSSSLIPSGQSFSKLEEKIRIYFKQDEEAKQDEKGTDFLLKRDTSLLKEAVIDYIGFGPKDFSEKFALNRQEVGEDNSSENVQEDLQKILEQTAFLTNLDPLSPISKLVQDLTSNLGSLTEEDIYNKFVAILPEVSQFLSQKTKFLSNEYIEDELEYKMFVTTYALGTSTIGFGIPTITKIITPDGEFSSGNFEDVELKEGSQVSIIVDNYDDSFAFNINGIKQRLNSSIEVVNNVAKIDFVLNKDAIDNLSTAGNLQKASKPEDPCNKMSLDSTNANYNLARKYLSEDYLSGDFSGSIGVTEEETSDLDDFKKAPLKFVDDIIDQGRSAENVINSFCDFSFSLTAELKGQLKGFKKVLTIVKVIFCIVDVLCSLFNPVKVGFAMIKLFNVLHELILLLPQLSVPVMLLALAIHILELLICLRNKTFYYINAINQIINALDFAIKAKNYGAIKNLEEVLKKYGIQFKRELDVIAPIQDTIDIFNEILESFFNFSWCKVDEDEGFCIDSSLIAGIISSQISDDGSLSYDKLIPLAQDYTTLDPETAICGNTPDVNSDISSKENSGGVNCGFGNIFKQVDEAIDSGNIKVAELDLTNPSATLDVDPENNRNFGFDFNASFTISATSMVNFGKTSVISFKEAGKTSDYAFNKLLSPIFKKKYIELDRTSDSKASFLNISNPEVSINTSSNPIEDGAGLVSFKDGFSDFLSGSSSSGYSVKPLRVKYTTLSGQSLSVTYDTVPSVVVMDDQFNMYYVKDGGFKVDNEGKIEKIIMNPISNKNPSNKNYQTEEQVVEVDQTILAEQANWDYLNSIVPTTSSYRVSGVLKTLQTSDYIILKNTGEITSDEYNEIDLNNRSYNYSGSAQNDDRLAFQNAIQTVQVLSFPQFYLVDMRQFSDLLSEACSATGFNDIIGAMEIDEDDVIDIVSDTEICTDEYVDFINNKLNTLIKDLDNGDLPEPLSSSEFEKAADQYEECLDDVVDRLCKFVVNPLNTSFLLVKDTLENSMEEVVDPQDVEPEVLENAVGLETPDITGASEYASGIGVESKYIVGEEVEIELTLRDSYDATIEHDFSDKIKINILSDSTGSGEVIKVNGNDVSKSGASYFAKIKSDSPGIIEISASVCSKTIKAFTFEGLTAENGNPASSVDEGCVEDAEAEVQSQTNNAALGSLIRIDRVLSIIIEEESFSETVSETNRTRIITEPQEFGTKVVN